MPEDRVHAEAEVLEHYISEELEALIAAKLGEPSHDPHGNPIPGPDLQPPGRRPVSRRREAAAGAPPRPRSRTSSPARPPSPRAARALARRRQPRHRPHLALPRPGLHRRRRLHRPRQLRHQHRRRRQVRLPAALGRPRRQPDRDGRPDAVGEARDRDRQEPRRALPRDASPGAPRSASGCRPRSSRWPATSPRSSAPRSASTCSSASRSSRPALIAGAGAFAILALQQKGFRRLEAAITALVGVVVASFVFELFDATPGRRRSRPAPLRPRLRRHREHPARHRDHRRDGDAARHLPALGADPAADRRPQRREKRRRSCASRRSTSSSRCRSPAWSTSR